jgi:hypothetical protein
MPQIKEIFRELRLYSVFYMEGETVVSLIKVSPKYDTDKPTEKPNLDVSGNAVLEIYDMDDPSQFIKFTMPLVGSNIARGTPIQSLGAISTYMKRYLYTDAMEITENDWFDAQTEEEEIKSEKKHDGRTEYRDDENPYRVLNNINSIKNIGELNRSFKLLKQNESQFKTTEWKDLIKEKAKSIGASYDKNVGEFFMSPI